MIILNENIHASKRGKIVIGILLVIIWSAFVAVSYTYSKNYFDSSINKLDQKYYEIYDRTNKEVNSLKGEIDTLKNEINTLNNSIVMFNDNMTLIFDDVSSIESVISETSVLQESTSAKLLELDSRLIELIKNLEILKKAPNE